MISENEHLLTNKITDLRTHMMNRKNSDSIAKIVTFVHENATERERKGDHMSEKREKARIEFNESSFLLFNHTKALTFQQTHKSARLNMFDIFHLQWIHFMFKNRFEYNVRIQSKALISIGSRREQMEDVKRRGYVFGIFNSNTHSLYREYSVRAFVLHKINDSLTHIYKLKWQ